MSKDSRRRRWTVILTIVVLTALTGCWSFQSFVFDRCPCRQQYWRPPTGPLPE
jgi:hypothetical protein